MIISRQPHIEINLRPWLIAAVIVKLIVFAYFTLNIDATRNPKMLVNGFCLVGGDSGQYFTPTEDMVHGEGYSTFCRLPGMMPIYAPLYAMLGEVPAKSIIVILQVLIDAFATVLLAVLAVRMFKFKSMFYWTLAIASVGTFVSMRAYYLLSDSFCISFLILAAYFFTQYLEWNNRKSLLYAGFFLCWSLFFRTVIVAAYPAFFLVLLVHAWSNKKDMIKDMAAFFAATIVFLGIWNIYNYPKLNRMVLIQPAVEECFSQYTPEFQSVRNLIMAMGEDFQPWNKTSAAHWFFAADANVEQSPFTADDYTEAYNLDSLKVLRIHFLAFRDSESDSSKAYLSNEVITDANRFRESYIHAHPMAYWVKNRIKFTREFLFPTHYDDHPFPKFSEMKWHSKLVVAGSLALLLIINLLGLLGMALALFKRNWKLVLWALLPFLLIFPLAYTGFIEQRYLATGYPFMSLFAVYPLALAWDWWKSRKIAKA